MIQTAYYWWKFPTTFQLSEIKIWNMASRTNIFLKCHKWIFCSNIIHRHRITLKLKFQFQYMMSVSRNFNLKQCKSIKAIPNVSTCISFITFHSSVKEADEFGLKENSIKVKSYSLLVQQENTSQGADQTDIYNIWLCNSGQSEGHVTSYFLTNEWMHC